MVLKINTQKIKYMYCTRSSNQIPRLLIDDLELEGVDTFVYLGSLLTKDNNVSEEIKRRIVLANKCYYGLRKQMVPKLPRQIKVTIYKTLIRPVLTYTERPRVA
ncbi:unnamed protein product [Diabrotica balteata]|uniref:Uncharacterized protein n=1 Tax=Diabrotica balteata TaxID=107213 RepID=A0A9N9SND8_DIABA|nr:unnamed protein product [Diabrotica balteata]